MPSPTILEACTTKTNHMRLRTPVTHGAWPLQTSSRRNPAPWTPSRTRMEALKTSLTSILANKGIHSGPSVLEETKMTKRPPGTIQMRAITPSSTRRSLAMPSLPASVLTSLQSAPQATTPRTRAVTTGSTLRGTSLPTIVKTPRLLVKLNPMWPINQTL